MSRTFYGVDVSGMKRLLRISIFVGVALCLLVAPVFADVSTEHKTIKRLQRSDGNTYVAADGGGWGAPGCPDATYVYWNETIVPNSHKEFTAMAMAAKLSRTTVYFSGTCNGSNYFIAKYMYME